MDESINVLIVHPRRVLREGLDFAVSHQQDMTQATSVASASEAIAMSSDLCPHVIIIDFGLPRRVGLAETHELHQAFPDAKILMMGATEQEADVLACIEAGAEGFFPEHGSLEDLLGSIRALAAGEILYSPRVVGVLVARIAKVARQQTRATPPLLAQLTRREREITRLIEQNLSNKEIAHRLHIETQTVKNHVHNILEKLQLSNRREAAQYAREHGLLQQGTGDRRRRATMPR